MAEDKTTNSQASSVKSVVARSDDGTIQITFTLPFELVKKTRYEAALELGKDIEVPGFRKGNAPYDKLISHIPENALLEKTLAKILPKLTADAINEQKIKPAIYPKFELVKAQEGEDWQIRATTCEIPEFSLGDYKQAVAATAKAKSIWIPGQAQGKPIDDEKPKEPTREEKEQEALKILLQTVNPKIPKVLIDEETNIRISQLLERLEKLGLNLDSYLASIGKTPQSLRSSYEEQAKSAIAIELILDKIARQENVKIQDKEIEDAITASSADKALASELGTPEKRRLVETVLKRRAVLESLTSLM